MLVSRKVKPIKYGPKLTVKTICMLFLQKQNPRLRDLWRYASGNLKLCCFWYSKDVVPLQRVDTIITLIILWYSRQYQVWERWPSSNCVLALFTSICISMIILVSLQSGGTLYLENSCAKENPNFLSETVLHTEKINNNQFSNHIFYDAHVEEVRTIPWW